MTRFFLSIFALCSLAFAQGVQLVSPQSQVAAASGTKVDEKNKCGIEGRVVAASTGTALKKAIVMLSPVDRRENRPTAATTDAEGNFSIKGINPGRFRLSASRRGYVTAQYGQTAPMRPGTVITLAAGQHMADVLFRLSGGAVITGRVQDEDGEPMSNVQVNALRQTYTDGKRILAPAGFGNTNDLGEYRIFGLAPGQYYVRAMFNGPGGGFAGGGGFGGGFAVVAAMGDSQQSADSAYAPLYYPGVQDASQAMPFNVRPGDEVRADFNMSPGHAFTVRGKLFNTTGSPGRPWITLVSRDESMRFSFNPSSNATVNADDTFELKHVLPGSYTLIARVEDEKNRLMARQNIDVVDRDVNNVVLAFRQAMDISGRVTATSNYQGRLRDITVFLQPDSSGMMSAATVGRTKDDGTFTVTGAGDDLYRVQVMLPQNAYVKSVRYGSEDVMENGLQPQRGASLDIVVSGEGGAISGTVSNSEQNAEPSVTVVAIPDRPLRWIGDRNKSTITDQNGHFNFQGLRPGRYRIYAFEDIEPGAYEDPQFMKKYQDRGKSIDISDNAQQNVDLTAISKDESD